MRESGGGGQGAAARAPATKEVDRRASPRGRGSGWAASGAPSRGERLHIRWEGAKTPHAWRSRRGAGRSFLGKHSSLPPFKRKGRGDYALRRGATPCAARRDTTPSAPPRAHSGGIPSRGRGSRGGGWFLLPCSCCLRHPFPRPPRRAQRTGAPREAAPRDLSLRTSSAGRARRRAGRTRRPDCPAPARPRPPQTSLRSKGQRRNRRRLPIDRDAPKYHTSTGAAARPRAGARRRSPRTREALLRAWTLRGFYLHGGAYERKEVVRGRSRTVGVESRTRGRRTFFSGFFQGLDHGPTAPPIGHNAQFTRWNGSSTLERVPGSAKSPRRRGNCHACRASLCVCRFGTDFAQRACGCSPSSRGWLHGRCAPAPQPHRPSA